MSRSSESARLNWPRWAQVLLIAVLAVLAINRMTMLVDTAAVRAGLYGELTWIGGTLAQDPSRDPGFVRVTEVAPGGPLAKAGVAKGDQVAFVHSYEYLRRKHLGERLAFTLDRDGVRSARTLVVERLPMDTPLGRQNSQRLLNALSVMLSMLIGIFIVWRGWGNKTVMLLGAALVTLGTGGFNLPPWASAPWLAVPMWSLVVSSFVVINLLLLFAMRMFEDHVGPLPRWHWRLAYAWQVLLAAWCLFAASDIVALTTFVSVFGGPSARLFVAAPGFAVAIGYLLVGWLRGDKAARSRFALLAIALIAYLVAGLVTQTTMLRTGSFFSGGWLDWVQALVVGLIAPSLLGYAVLRHKLFDLGFAINRTLVFGAITTILLVSFGTLEWAVEHLVPESWHEGSAFYSAAIAVGLFLLFHRIRDAVEHVIERLFFRSWHENEAALKRFVATAAHVERPQALAGNFAGELARFSGGASASVYARTPKGNYASASGDTIDADDPALAAMRAEQGAVVPVEVSSPIEAALALPMMHQAALAGFVLLGPKPSGEDYRPDEIDNLAWATQQVGLDLQAIRVRELEQTVIKLEARNANLSEILAKAAVAEV